MFKLWNVLKDEEGDEGLAGGAEPEGEGEIEGEPEPPAGWLRDITEDDAYNTLQSAKQFPDHLRGLESRLFGRFGPLQEKLNSIEKSIGTRVNFDGTRIKKALDAYDGSGALSEALVPALQEALQVNPLDENAISPYLNPVQDNLRQWAAEQIVLASYDPGEIAEMIPEVVNGRFAPANQRQKDFVDWYSLQGYDTQQALLQFGAPYVQALRKFERWEKDKTQERTKKAGVQSSRLAGGQQVSSQGRRPKKGEPQTAEEAFLAGYNEVD
jgi:hypothetical protein